MIGLSLRFKLCSRLHHPQLGREDTLLVFRIHAAFVEVNGSISAAGTLKVMDEVKAPQTSGAVLTVEFPDGPLCLRTNNGCNESPRHLKTHDVNTNAEVCVCIRPC